MIIALDGPSGAGKSTIAKAVAKRLGFSCLDTGAMYRSVAWWALNNGIALEDGAALSQIACEKQISFEVEPGDPAPKKVLIDGVDVTSAIRTGEIDRAVSTVSSVSDVRTALVEQQRRIGNAGDYVVEGRDIGTTVFPQAQVKVFMTASAEERARRRVKQNEERGIGDVDYQKVLGAIGEHVGQVLMTTRSNQVMQHVGSAITVPVGRRSDGSMANILRGLDGDDKAFLLVEGKYDLPWYKEAAALSGFGARVNILPAGGTNIDELRRELASINMKCVSIVDGDTPPDEKTAKFALARECVELYTPDELLQSLFGIVPPTSGKREFFAAVQAAKPSSENGIKAAIAEKIAAHLTPASEFVREVGSILKRAL